MSHKAFTLIELLVVIAIIGLLATIAVVSLNQARIKGYDAKRTADIKQISTAMQMYLQDNGTYPDPGALLCAGGSSQWYCLGQTSASTCWEGGFHGRDGLNTALAPYIVKIPDDPVNDTSYWGDAYLYNFNQSSLWNGITGTIIHWYLNEPTNSNNCLNGIYGTGNSTHWWCAIKLTP